MPSGGTSRVAAIIVTRGDQDILLYDTVIPSLPVEWEVLVWDNGRETLYSGRKEGTYWSVADLSVYGRYAAIEYTDADLIYVQDDDCVVSDPQAIVDVWGASRKQIVLPARERPGQGFDGPQGTGRYTQDHVVCNMPPEFRHDFYEEHALVGFGACFHRDAPQRAFDRLGLTALPGSVVPDIDFFYRTCDVVFTALTPRVLVDVPHRDLPYAHHETRMWKQPGHQADRVRMLDLVRQVRDA